MTKVLLEVSVSMDDRVTGPDISPEEPMGRGGEQLHDWMFEARSEAETEAFQVEHFRGIGAVIVVRRMADLCIGPWGEEPAFHARSSWSRTGRPRPSSRGGGTSYTFVTSGIDDALSSSRSGWVS